METKLSGVVLVMTETQGDRCLQGEKTGAETHMRTEAQNCWGGERDV